MKTSNAYKKESIAKGGFKDFSLLGRVRKGYLNICRIYRLTGFQKHS